VGSFKPTKHSVIGSFLVDDEGFDGCSGVGREDAEESRDD